MSRISQSLLSSLVTGAIGIVLGSMFSDLPKSAGWWALGGLVPAYILISRWGSLNNGQKKFYASALGFLLLICLFFSVRSYLGRDYDIQYRVCGYVRSNAGFVDTVYVGIHFFNPTSDPVFVRAEDKNFTIGDRSSTTQLVKLTSGIKPSDGTSDTLKTADYISFDPPLKMSSPITGKLDYKVSFSKSADNLDRKLRIEGMLNYDLSEDDTDDTSIVRFTPNSDMTNSYLGSCDMRSEILMNNY